MLLKLMQTFVMKKFLLLMALFLYKWLLPLMFHINTGATPASFHISKEVHAINMNHPFFVSVTEFNHNPKDKILEISCKMFADDLENALKAQYKTVIDISHPKDAKQLEKYIFEYLQKHLQAKINGKAVTFQFVGYEKEEEAVWGYLQVNNAPLVKKLEVTNNILYEMNTAQTSIMHASSGGNHKSTRLMYPDTQASFEW